MRLKIDRRYKQKKFVGGDNKSTAGCRELHRESLAAQIENVE